MIIAHQTQFQMKNHKNANKPPASHQRPVDPRWSRIDIRSLPSILFYVTWEAVLMFNTNKLERSDKPKDTNAEKEEMLMKTLPTTEMSLETSSFLTSRLLYNLQFSSHPLNGVQAWCAMTTNSHLALAFSELMRCFFNGRVAKQASRRFRRVGCWRRKLPVS